MPTPLSYPGVYIEEIPSGVRTIVGVATSITAFLGRALRGPVNKPVILGSFSEFEREFGGLWAGNSLGYSVRDFFLNGGGQAVVVRIHRAKSGSDGRARLVVGGLKLAAKSPGAWGSGLRAEVSAVDEEVAQAAADDLGVPKEDLFNLRVTETSSGTDEMFRNVTVKRSRRRIDEVLKASSTLVSWDGDFPADAHSLPTVSAALDTVSGKRATLAEAEKNQGAADTKLAAATKKVAAAQKALDAANAETPKDQGKIDAAQSALDAAKTEATTAKTEADAAKTAADTARTAVTAAAQEQDGNDGEALQQGDFLPTKARDNKAGLFALEDTDLFNLLCIPPYKGDDVDPDLIAEAARYCEERRAMLLVDPPSAWVDPASAITGKAAIGTTSRNAALFFPRLVERDPLRENRPAVFAPCGAVAGVMARTDVERGVWKAPAGLAATVSGVVGLSVALTDSENGRLNLRGINCLRTLPNGAPATVWGARTVQGDDRLASEWKYIPVRRLTLFIEESLFRGTQWVVFEPNDEPLWSQIRLNVGAFMHDLFRQGAFQGQTPNEAYLVKVDKQTTTQSDINRGIVNILVGFAPLVPAEFVILKIQQLAGRIET
ncbi:phage tail sheath family protein [Streptomyces sp. NPDC001530]|uniref:phage tail sheath family protein n=1 Tax=Streptomyces sp. NPDC001530 TaxID=3364582 RepID=UPI00369E728D